MDQAHMFGWFWPPSAVAKGNEGLARRWNLKAPYSSIPCLAMSQELYMNHSLIPPCQAVGLMGFI